MDSKNIEVNVARLSQGRALQAALVEVVGKGVAAFVGNYCGVLKLAVPFSAEHGEEAYAAMQDAMIGLFTTGMKAMNVEPEKANAVLKAAFESTVKIDVLVTKFVEGLQEQGASLEEVQDSNDQLHAYLEAHLDLTEQIATMEN